jgi:hypothetical protein
MSDNDSDFYMARNAAAPGSAAKQRMNDDGSPVVPLETAGVVPGPWRRQGAEKPAPSPAANPAVSQSELEEASSVDYVPLPDPGPVISYLDRKGVSLRKPVAPSAVTEKPQEPTNAPVNASAQELRKRREPFVKMLAARLSRPPSEEEALSDKDTKPSAARSTVLLDVRKGEIYSKHAPGDRQRAAAVPPTGKAKGKPSRTKPDVKARHEHARQMGYGSESGSSVGSFMKDINKTEKRWQEQRNGPVKHGRGPAVDQNSNNSPITWLRDSDGSP